MEGCALPSLPSLPVSSRTLPVPVSPLSLGIKVDIWRIYLVAQTFPKIF